MKYVVTKNESGEFTGFCSEEQFNRSREVFLQEDDDAFEVFDGPEYDGTDETFAEVRRIARSRCVDSV